MPVFPLETYANSRVQENPLVGRSSQKLQL